MYKINKNQVNFYQIDENSANQRLDNFLIKILKGVPKSHIYRIIRSGEVRINKIRADPASKIKSGDIIRIPPVRIANYSHQDYIPPTAFPVLYEDEYYLIINKPHKIACHGGSGVSFGVIEQLRQNTNYKFLELAHRLDKETSGILILAKKRQALIALQELMKNNQMIKEYYALSCGNLRDERRNVKAPIYKFINKNGERRVRIDNQGGQFAHTVFTLLKKYRGFSLINAKLETGRTHQIRIHLQHIGLPIAGDEKYGDFAQNRILQRYGLKRMFLHAHHIQFIHPITHQIIEVKSELPQELTEILNNLDM